MAVAGVAVPGCAGSSQPAPVLSGARSVCLDMRPIAIHKGCVLVAIEAILPRALRLRLLPAGLLHRRHCSTTEEGARRSITGQDMNTARSTHARGARGVSALDSDTADQTRSPRRLTAAGELISGAYERAWHGRSPCLSQCRAVRAQAVPPAATLAASCASCSSNEEQNNWSLIAVNL